MSKRIVRCPKCGEKTNISAFSNIPDILQCCACNFKGNRGAFETFITTVFDRITASPEVLAENFIHKILTEHDEYKWRGEIGYINWKSAEFDSKAEAIAATVEKLKEVEK